MFRGFRSRPAPNLPSGGSLAELLGLRVPDGGADGLWWLAESPAGEPVADPDTPPLVRDIIEEPPLISYVDHFGIPRLKPPPPVLEPLAPAPFREFSEDYRTADPVDLSTYGIEQRTLYDIESRGDPFTYREVPNEDDPSRGRSFIGLGQYSKARLIDLGYYVGDDALYNYDWTGHFVGLDNVYDYIDFMNNVSAQDEVYEAEMDRTTRYMEGRGLDSYVGQTVHDIPMTPSAIRFGAHIGGEQGMSDWLTGENGAHDVDGADIPHHARFGSAISREELRAPGASSMGWERPMRPGEFFLPIPSPLPDQRR